jgi:hypothetical protein
MRGTQAFEGHAAGTENEQLARAGQLTARTEGRMFSWPVAINPASTDQLIHVVTARSAPLQCPGDRPRRVRESDHPNHPAGGGASIDLIPRVSGNPRQN